MVSLSDVAKKAGVSIATASLALRGRGQVAAKTVERIRKAAEELGYRPNPLLASLATKRFRSQESVEGTPLAIFEFPRQLGARGSGADERYPAEITTHARNLGYSPTLYRLTNASAAGPLFKELYHRMAQGIVIVGSMDMETFGREMDWGQFSVVVCARFASSLPFHTVRPNIFQGIKLSFEMLRRHGYQRIGFALGQHETPMEDDDARHGAAIALENRYLPKSCRVPPYSGGINDREAFLKWVRKEKPEAVVGFSAGYYWYLKDAGLRVPEDIGFAGLHLDGAESPVRLSGLMQNRAEIARQSVLLLDQLVRNRERGLPAMPLNILVPSIWVEGDTLRKREAL